MDKKMLMRCSFRAKNMSNDDFTKLGAVRVVRVHESDEKGFIEFPIEKYTEIRTNCTELNELERVTIV